MGIRLKNSIAAALSFAKSKPLGSFTFFGSAGLLDREEGTMSFLLRLDTSVQKCSILVDCGPRVFDKMYGMAMWADITAIVLTSSSEASIGSLAAVSKMIHAHTNRPVPIVCMPHIGRMAYEYLVDANGMSKDMFDFQLAKPDVGDMPFMPEPSIRQTFKKTSDTTSMFVLEIMMEDVNMFILHSGIIDRAAFDLLEEMDDEDVLSKMKKRPDNVIVLHDAVLKKQAGRCSHEQLKDWNGKFNNTLLFGHPLNEGNGIVFQLPKMRSLSVNNSYEFLIEKQ